MPKTNNKLIFTSMPKKNNKLIPSPMPKKNIILIPSPILKTDKIRIVIYILLALFSAFNFAILILMLAYPYLVSPNELIELPNSIEDIKNILFSDKVPGESSKITDKELNKSIGRVGDFIRLTQKGGSGIYPEDFNFEGYKRDDNSVIHSKAPGDWGINELFDFGNYSDVLKRKASAAQMALWLEYDCYINNRFFVTSASENPSLNSSGLKWIKDYCNDHDVKSHDFNKKIFRDKLREFSNSNN